MIGGIKVIAPFKSVAHSDGDCLLHAITESIIGALGLGDLGTLFPDNDPRYKNIESNKLLEFVVDILEKENYNIVNIDTIVYLEKPKLKEYQLKIKEKVAQLLKVDQSKVNIKATTGEKIGIIGTSQAYVAEAVVLINKEL